MAKYKIIYDREACIGVFACIEAAKKYWIRSPKDEGKVDLKGGKLNPKTGKYELIIDEKDFKMVNESAVVCPVVAIKIEKVED
ncbi:MAG TPA: ferredoxin [Candidatus Nanoarchaeia archaeon]|nr:ferredoxin [Candidatus Nanoarchaeia archaeon]